MTEILHAASCVPGASACSTTIPLDQRRKASFGRLSALAYDEPVHLVRAEGVWMYDVNGRAYLDVYNNVPSVGHCHPHVVAAVAKQAATLATNTRYLYDNVHDYAERLLGTFPAPLSTIVLTCTGSESNDLALRMARKFTGRGGFIVTNAAYHGNTEAVAAISPAHYHGAHVPPHVRLVAAPGSDGAKDESTGARFAGDVQAAIRDLEESGIGFAALIIDPIFASDGIFADPIGFLRPAIEAVHAAGGVFIADEVQSGFGRTGLNMWGHLRHGLEADIVTLGKPTGNGFPIGGLITRPEILSRFGEQSRYFNTFGGNPVAAAAGMAVLEVLEAEDLLSRADEVGKHLRTGLRVLMADIPDIRDVRGAGLFVGVEITCPETREPDRDRAGFIVNALRKQGILIGATGRHGNTLKLRPPLCFSRENADHFLGVLGSVMTAR